MVRKMGKKNSLKVNYIFNMLYQVLAIALPLVTTPYISRVLGPSGIGAYNYSYSIAAVFVLVANLGTNIYAQREIAFEQENIYERSVVFWEILLIRSVMTILVTPIYFGLAIVKSEYTTLLFIQYMLLLATAIDVSWLFQGMEEFKKVALRNIVIKLVSVGLIFLCVRTNQHTAVYTAIIAGSTLASALILWWYLRKVVEKVALKKLHPMKHWKGVLLLFLPYAAIYVYTYVDKIVLEALSTKEQVGYYSQSENIVKLSMTLITSLGAVMLPHVASLIKQEKWDKVVAQVQDSIYFVLFLGTPMMLGIIAIAPVFVPWFLGEQYSACISLLQYLSPLILIIGMTNVTGQAALIPLNKQVVYTSSIVMGAVFNLVCNILLIPSLKATGAVIGTLGAELIVGLIQQYTVYKALNIRWTNLIIQSWKCIASAIGMYVLVVFVRTHILSNVVALLMSLVCGVMTYMILLFLFREKMVLQYWKAIITRLRKNK